MGARSFLYTPYFSLIGSHTSRRTVCSQDSYRRQRDSALEPAVDQLRLVGKDRVRRDILKEHSTLKSNRQPHSGQRRAAELEEVIPPANLVPGDAKHFRPHSRQPFFSLRTRL